MTKEELINIRKYINKFNTLKISKDVKIYTNEESNVTFIVSYSRRETIIGFYTTKSAIDFVIAYNRFSKRNIKIPQYVINKSEFLFNKFINTLKNIDKMALNFRNIKLINPFRNYVSEGNNEFYDYYNKNKQRIYLHSGFVLLFNSISDVLYDIMNSLKNKTDNIVFIGQSFGAPIAEISYISFILAHPDFNSRSSCYLFGSPKIGNVIFENLISRDNKIYHINIQNDLITKVPLDKLGYANPRHLLTIPNKDNDKFGFGSCSYAEIINKRIV